MAALVAALWAYDGWNDLNMVAGEVKRPERNIPIALIAGVATVGVLYVLMNAGVQYVLPASTIAASPRPASDAVALVMGRMGASIVSAGMAISMLVTLNGTIMSGARVPFAVARDGYFFERWRRYIPGFTRRQWRLQCKPCCPFCCCCSGQIFANCFLWRFFRNGCSI